MFGRSGYVELDAKHKEHQELNKRRLWTERFNQAYVDLTGDPFVDDNPARTTELFNNLIPAEEAAKRVATEGNHATLD